MNAPPAIVIEQARRAAMCSPCVKSRRGVVAFNPNRSDLGPFATAIGWNGQPRPFACTGSGTCRKHCAELCLHAEQRAILLSLLRVDLAELELVHVKVVAEQVVAGKGPCCLQCSRLMLEVGMAGIWLYESTEISGELHVDDPPCTCGARAELTARSLGETVVHELGCPSMHHFAGWRRYAAEEFHRETMRNVGAVP